MLIRFAGGPLDGIEDDIEDLDRPGDLIGLRAHAEDHPEGIYLLNRLTMTMEWELLA